MAVNPFNWECPYCNQKQVVTDPQYHESFAHIDVRRSNLGDVGLVSMGIACSNDQCNRLTLNVALRPDNYVQGGGYWLQNKSKEFLFVKRILPESYSKPQPNYIPAALREDYEEACAIRDLSPKASATLSRRCLQGMIRDFCKISKNRLIDEIEALNKALKDDRAPAGVTPESIEAIDAVREVGNIGAHMEKDIDHIVPVDPGEAQVLIELIESLFDEWYVARERRKTRFAAVGALAEDKKKLIKELRASDPKAIADPKPQV